MECVIEPELNLEQKSFEVKLHFVAIYVNEPSDDLSEYQIEVNCLNEKLIASKCNDIEIKLENKTLDYVLKITHNNFGSILTAETFIFSFFGNPLIVQLVKVVNSPEPQSSKIKSNKKISQNRPTTAYVGQINAFECLISSQSNEHNSVINHLKLDGESIKEVVTLEYTIEFHNPPEIYNMFSINVLNMLNFPNNDNNLKIEIGFYLPLNAGCNERIYLRDLSINNISSSELTGLHYDTFLKESGFQVDFSNAYPTNLCYQNYLTENNVNYLRQLNEDGLELLIEIKVTNVLGLQNHCMTILNFGIFNHEGGE